MTLVILRYKWYTNHTKMAICCLGARMKQWQIPNENETDTIKAARLSEMTGMGSLLSCVLVSRGITTPEQAKTFLSKNPLSDPFLIQDMDKAVSVISDALENGDKITIYGDYDCDGVTSVVMLYSYFMTLGANTDWYIPSREEGYGLNLSAIDAIIQNGTRLIVTVDNGISAIKEAEYIREKGLKLVITDHHKPPKTLPVADAVINPNREDDLSLYKSLAGCGVALKLIMALEGDSEGVLEQYAPLAAIGTIGDIVPLTGENREIVKTGLEHMMYTDNVGLLCLLKASGVDPENLTATSLAFSVCPRINAAGRFAHAKLAAQLLLCENFSLATAKAQELSALNVARQEEEQKVLNEIKTILAENPALLRRRVLILVGENWHHGVIGIVSARLLARFGKPCIIISKEGQTARGSARSMEGFSVHACLEACGEHLDRYGGHMKAGGFSLRSDTIEPFINAVYTYAKEYFPTMPYDTLQADVILSPKHLTIPQVRELEHLQPVGEENPLPLFFLKGCTVLSKKPLKDGKYVSFELDFQGLKVKALHFGMTYNAFGFSAGDRVDIMANLLVSEFNGQESISLRIKDIRPTGFQQEKTLSALFAYDRLCLGEFQEFRLLSRVIPSLEEIRQVYDILRTECFLDNIQMKALKIGQNACKLRLVLDILSECGIIAVDEYENTATLLKVKQKADLSTSKTMIMLKELEKRGETGDLYH